MKWQDQSWWQAACLRDVTCKWILKRSQLLSRFRLPGPVTCGHFRGKGVAFSWLPLSRCEVSPNFLAWSMLSAVHLSVLSTPLPSSSNHFRNNETFPSDMSAEPATAWCWEAGSEVWAGPWAGEWEQDGFRERSRVFKSRIPNPSPFGPIPCFQAQPGLTRRYLECGIWGKASGRGPPCPPSHEISCEEKDWEPCNWAWKQLADS